jgi:hypothetical protein
MWLRRARTFRRSNPLRQRGELFALLCVAAVAVTYGTGKRVVSLVMQVCARQTN